MKKILSMAQLFLVVCTSSGWALDISHYPVLQELIRDMESEDGYPADALLDVLSGARIDQETLRLMDNQWEALPWHQYRDLFINHDRIRTGVKFWDTHGALLERAQEEYGIPASIIVALIGVETHYGTRIGNRNVLNSLVTLSAAYPRRSKFFTSELRTFLNTAREENIDPSSVIGSYAGAIGIPQFMPSSYAAYSVDFNQNGKRDLVNEYADAIGSVAHYLDVHGWKAGQGIFSPLRGEISENHSHLVRKSAKPVHSIDTLLQHGILFDHDDVSGKVSLLALKEQSGTRYVVGFQNLYVLTRYNTSVNYAMAVTELSRAISEMKQD